MAVDEVIFGVVDFVCPFCGRRASAGYKGSAPCVLHAMPQCEKFEQLEPDEYLAQVNDAMGHPRPS